MKGERSQEYIQKAGEGDERKIAPPPNQNARGNTPREGGGERKKDAPPHTQNNKIAGGTPPFLFLCPPALKEKEKKRGGNKRGTPGEFLVLSCQ